MRTLFSATEGSAVLYAAPKYRYFSLNLANVHISCGISTFDENGVYFGVRKWCANGVRFNLWNAYLVVAVSR